MLPNIQPEHSGELEGPRHVKSAERIHAALAHAPADADRGEVARGRRVDGVDISPRGEQLARHERRIGRLSDDTPPRERDDVESEAPREGEEPADGDAAVDLSSEELRRVRELERIDRVVRARENVLRAVAPDVVSGEPTFAYEVGPDGRRYATEGESDIELPTEADPDVAAEEAARALRAALAASAGSNADPSIALRAASIEARARAQIRREEGAVRDDELDALRAKAAAAYEAAREPDGDAPRAA
jgi:hypothetical protein